MTERDLTVERALELLEVEAINFAYRFVKDSRARQWYISKTKTFVSEIRAAHASGQLSARQAAEAAHQMRNEVMELARVRSSDMGRAKAKSLKSKGLAFDELVKKYSEQKMGKPFDRLSSKQQQQVMMEIVDAAGRPNPKVSLRAQRLGAAGRGLWVLTFAIAGYNIFTAEDKVEAAKREGVTLGGGVAGGAGGGAIAGIWFGPVGIAVGAAIGGIVGAFVADEVYVEVAGVKDATVKAIIDPYTMPGYTNEEGLAGAIDRHCGIDMDKTHAVFIALERNYSTDADDVAVIFLNRLKQEGGARLRAFRMHTDLQRLLIHILDGGWTSGEEENLKRWIQYL